MVRICLILLIIPSLVIAAEPMVNVAVYVGSGTSGGKAELFKSLDQNKSVKYSKVTVEDIQAGKLKDYNTVIFPGGGGGSQGKALEEKGREAVRNYVKEGGSYIGICAGSYLATNDYTWSLGILNAKVVDKAHWARGHGPVKLTLTDKAKDLLQQKDKEIEIVYWQGSVACSRQFQRPARVRSVGEIRYRNRRKWCFAWRDEGNRRDCLKQLRQRSRSLFSPHPEKTESTYKMINGAIIWVNERSK